MAGRPRNPQLDGDILDAARHLIRTAGSAGCTIGTVASYAGVPRSTVYSRWPSRHALIDAAIAPLFTNPVPDTGDERADLRSWLDADDALISGPFGIAAATLLATSREPDGPMLADLATAIQQRRRDVGRRFGGQDEGAQVKIRAVYDAMWGRCVTTGPDHGDGPRASSMPEELMRLILDA